MNYIITEIEKHNLGVDVLNASFAIRTLNARLKAINPIYKSDVAEEILLQLQNAQRTLDNLMPVHETVEAWQDNESDVQK